MAHLSEYLASLGFSTLTSNATNFLSVGSISYYILCDWLFAFHTINIARGVFECFTCIPYLYGSDFLELLKWFVLLSSINARPNLSVITWIIGRV